MGLGRAKKGQGGRLRLGQRQGVEIKRDLNSPNTFVCNYASKCAYGCGQVFILDCPTNVWRCVHAGIII